MNYYPDEALVLRGAAVTQLSDDNYFELCQANKLLHIEREPGGELLVRPLPGCAVSQLSAEVLGQLGAWRRAHGGHALSWCGFRLPDGSVRSPALAWVNYAAHARLTPAQRAKFPPLCPEFVIEIKANIDLLATCQHLLARWLTNGGQLGFC